MSLDFRLKNTSERVGGLNMGLCPGEHRSRSNERAIFFAEDVFGFVEPSIARHWPQYSHYGHWGITRIPRQEWLEIINDLERLKARVAALTALQGADCLRFLFKEVEIAFMEDLQANKAGLQGMIDELTAWLRLELQTNDFITIFGI